MSDLISWLLLAACIPNCLLIYIAIRRYVSKLYEAAGYEPIVDYDALQMELDSEFAPLAIDRAARLSA